MLRINVMMLLTLMISLMQLLGTSNDVFGDSEVRFYNCAVTVVLTAVIEVLKTVGKVFMTVPCEIQL